MNRSHLVTAIITTHNRLPLLKRAIDSVQSQTYTNIELIVVDDGSTDGTREYCENQPFSYIYIAHNQRPASVIGGGNYARNVGVKAAHGEYVAFLDDDDAWLPEKIEKQVALIESKDCELVYGGVRYEQISAEGVSYQDFVHPESFQGDMSHRILLTTSTTTTSNILARRDAVIEAGMFDVSLAFWQEYELLIRMAQRKPFYFVPEPTMLLRIDASDQQRLTNQYFRWRKTVSQIQRKHHQLYAQLSLHERMLVKRMVWADAALRCVACGLVRRRKWYRGLLLIFDTCEQLRKRFAS